MKPPRLPVACPRCSFTIELNAERVIQGPVTRTCPACGLLFRVGRGSEKDYPEDPIYETSSGWYLRKVDGTVLYFPDLKVLQLWASDGMISLTDEISKKGVDWKRVHTLPEFASLAMSGSSPKDSTMSMARPNQYNDVEGSTQEILTELDFIDPTSGRRNALFVGLAFVVGCLGTWFLVSFLSSGPTRAPASSPATKGGGPSAIIESPNSEAPFALDVVAATGPDTTSAASDPGGSQGAADVSRNQASGVDTASASQAPIKAESPRKKPKRKKVRPRNRRASSGLTYDKLMNVGNSQLRTNPSKATLTFMKALQMRDATSEARAKLGRAYLRSGNLREAIDHLERAIKSNPKYRPALKDLAAAYTQRGSREDAIRVLRRLQRMVARNSHDYRWIKRKLQSLGTE